MKVFDELVEINLIKITKGIIKIKKKTSIENNGIIGNDEQITMDMDYLEYQSYH